MADAIDPNHYTNPRTGTQVIDLISGEDYERGNVIKYVFRAGKKNPAKKLEDYLKARKYLDWLIEQAEDEAEVGRKEAPFISIGTTADGGTVSVRAFDPDRDNLSGRINAFL